MFLREPKHQPGESILQDNSISTSATKPNYAITPLAAPYLSVNTYWRLSNNLSDKQESIALSVPGKRADTARHI